MSQEYTEDKEVTLTKLSSGRRLLEALLILIVLFAVWLMAALLSFNPSDPSWSQTAWHEPIHNLGGMPGAWLADTLFFIFGVMAYTIPVIIVGGCWFAWRHQSSDEYIDYFAVSLPDLLIWDDDLNVRNLIHCNLVMGLGYLGLGDKEQARRFLSEVVRLDINHQVGQQLLNMCE